MLCHALFHSLVTHLLQSLPWLHGERRIQFKIALTTQKIRLNHPTDADLNASKPITDPPFTFPEVISTYFSTPLSLLDKHDPAITKTSTHTHYNHWTTRDHLHLKTTHHHLSTSSAHIYSPLDFKILQLPIINTINFSLSPNTLIIEILFSPIYNPRLLWKTINFPLHCNALWSLPFT